MTQFALNQSLDLDALRSAFADEGRLQIHDFLRHDGAMALLRELVESREWRLAQNQGADTIEHGAAEMAAWAPEVKAAFDRQAFESGRHGFQFRYDAIRLPESLAAPAPAASATLHAFRAFLSSAEVLDVLRKVTGADDIAFADAHGARYREGHFLTAHDDSKDEAGRRVAYVMNLTPQWRPDWGGLLLFYDGRGNVSRGFLPAFNVLNLFRVPQPHSVSWVTPLAGAPRHSVTGWLRAGRPD